MESEDVQVQELITKLTPRQHKFCLNYLMEPDASKAALDAGYEQSYIRQAYKLLENPTVKSFIDSHRREVVEKTKVTLEWKIKKLEMIVEICVPDGAKEKWEIDPKGACSAISLLNQMQGDNAPVKIDARHLHINATIERLKDIRREYGEF